MQLTPLHVGGGDASAGATPSINENPSTPTASDIATIRDRFRFRNGLVRTRIT
jgi:hypothetical protein